MIKFIIYYVAVLIIFIIRVLSRKKKLIILNYHRILDNDERPFSVFDRLSSRDFDEQIFFLKRFFNIIPLDKALFALEQNNLPPNSLCITFDDGYVECYEKVLPILKRHDITACFFITTAGMNQGKTWETEIELCVETAFRKKLKIQVDDFFLTTDTIESSLENTKKLTQLVKYKTLLERERIIESIKEQVGDVGQRYDYMNPAQVKKLSESGMLIGAHTVNHPILSLENEDVCEREIATSKKTLEEVIGRSIDMFAYPNGKYDVDFNSNTMRIVQNIGFRYALSSDWGICSDLNYDKLKIKRLFPWDKKPIMYVFRIVFTVFLSK